jgi:lysozyme
MNQRKKRFILIVFLLLFAILSFWAVQKYWLPQAVTPRIKGFEVHGIDVSHHQKVINWNRVKSDPIDFVFMKATEGENFLDPRFKYNWRKAYEKRFIRGAYHFYRPSVSSTIQAQHFIRTVQLASGDLPPVLDLEVTDNRPQKIIIEGAKNWLTMIESHYGVKPIIYTNRDWYKKYVKGNFEDYTIWMAAYTTFPLPKLDGEKKWDFWQYTNNGAVQGVNGAVDLNVFYGTREEMKELIIP